MDEHVWKTFAAELVKRLENEDEITLLMKEVIVTVGVAERTIRGRSFWIAAQRGDNFIDVFAKSRIEIEFSPNALGEEVRTVTFRLAERAVSS